jgi:hypothetical protein
VPGFTTTNFAYGALFKKKKKMTIEFMTLLSASLTMTRNLSMSLWPNWSDLQLVCPITNFVFIIAIGK